METSNKEEKVKKDSNIFTKETAGMLMVLFATICFVCLVTRGMIFSSVGEGVSYFLLGLFGYSAYVQCLLCIYFGVTLVIGKGFNISKKASTVFSLIFVLTIFLLHGITSAKFAGLNYGQYLGNCYKIAKDGIRTSTGGGLVAGTLVYWALKLFTPVGFYIVIAVILALLGYYIYKNGIFTKKEKVVETQSEADVASAPVSVAEDTDDVSQVFENMFGGDVQTAKKNPLYVANGPAFEALGKRDKENNLILNISEKGLNVASVKADEVPNPKQDLASSIEYIKRPQPLDIEKTLNNFKTEIKPVSVSETISKAEEPVKEFSEKENAMPDYSDAVVATGNVLDDYFNKYERKKYSSKSQDVSTTVPTVSESVDNEVADFSADNAVVDNAVTQDFSSYMSDFSVDGDIINEDVYQEPIVEEVEETPIVEDYKPFDYSIGSISEVSKQDDAVTMDFSDEDFGLTDGGEDFVEEVNEPIEEPIVEEVQTATEVVKENIVEDVQPPFEVVEEKPAIKPLEEVSPSASIEKAIDDEYAKEINSAPDMDEAMPVVEEKPPRSVVTDYAKRIAPSPKPEPKPAVAPTPAPVAPIRPAPVIQPKVEVAPAPKPEKPKVVEPINRPYYTPPLSYLVEHSQNVKAEEDDHETRMRKIEETLEAFHVTVKGENYIKGPAVTRYEFSFPMNYPIKNILSIEPNLNASLELIDGVRILAPIPGKNLIGIEVANNTRIPVSLKSGIKETMTLPSEDSSLLFPIGKDVVGKTVHYDIAKGKHFLVAGSTGSGKSIFLNSLILSLIMRYSPEDLKLILIDPKTVEFMVYGHLPHLMVDEIISEPAKVLAVLDWAYQEMERRYKVFRDCGTRVVNIEGYNKQIASDTVQKMPRIVIIIDEVADLMNICKKELEKKVAALTAKARASGIHLILATQRPSVDVITGVIKANLPTRVAFKTISAKDSETILGSGGAEKLLGKGDMLFKIDTAPLPDRYQGAFVNETETYDVVDYIIKKNKAYFSDDLSDFLENAVNPPAPEKSAGGGDTGEVEDEMFPKTLAYAVDSGVVSISALLRRFSIGHGRAGRLIDKMANLNYITQSEGQKPRRVLLTKEQFIEMYGEVDY